MLYVTSAPVINISGKLNNTKLVAHNKDVTFDDQKGKGYGRLNIIFSVETQKLFLRFNFTLSRGYWHMKAVEVEYNEYKSVLPVVGTLYSIPSAPIGFSYRCSSRSLQFGNESDGLIIHDFQVTKIYILIKIRILKKNVLCLGTTLVEWHTTLRRRLRLCRLHYSSDLGRYFSDTFLDWHFVDWFNCSNGY